LRRIFIASEGRHLLRVIGAGFGRTGTSSLRRALEILGFGRCYHFTEMLRCRHVRQWLRIARGERADWDVIFDGFSATTDWPAAAYYRELFEHYPQSRVILTVRDREAWHDSLCHTLLPLRGALKRWLPGASAIGALTDAVIWDRTFAGKAHERAHSISVFDSHCEEVRKAIPADRLLVFDVSDGWEPLCRFLGVAQPAGVPFPRVNDTAAVRRFIWLLLAARYVAAAALAAILIALTAIYL
jgi:hypothetical protein